MSEPQNQKAKTETFRALHQGKILILPNAWDAASARIVQQAGHVSASIRSPGEDIAPFGAQLSGVFGRVYGAGLPPSPALYG